MDVEAMTTAEIEQVLAEKRAEEGSAEPEFKSVTVDGITLTIDIAKFKSWKAFDMIAAIEDTGKSNVQRLMKIVEFVEFVSGVPHEELLARFGGEMADFMAVSDFCTRVIRELRPKN